MSHFYMLFDGHALLVSQGAAGELGAVTLGR